MLAVKLCVVPVLEISWKATETYAVKCRAWRGAMSGNAATRARIFLNHALRIVLSFFLITSRGKKQPQQRINNLTRLCACLFERVFWEDLLK